jgi:hypothetical protein
MKFSYSPHKENIGERCIFAWFAQPKPGTCGHPDNPLNGQCNGMVNDVCIRILQSNKANTFTQQGEVVIFQG